MSLALGLTLLKRIHLIDWFAEDGYVNLDLLEHSGGKFEDYPEFLQLSKSLAETKCYRAWCASQSLKEIQLSIVQNGLLLAPQIEDGESSVVRERNEHVNADGP